MTFLLPEPAQIRCRMNSSLNRAATLVGQEADHSSANRSDECKKKERSVCFDDLATISQLLEPVCAAPLVVLQLHAAAVQKIAFP